MNYWKQISHVMKYFRVEEDPKAHLPKNFVSGFLEVQFSLLISAIMLIYFAGKELKSSFSSASSACTYAKNAINCSKSLHPNALCAFAMHFIL